DFFGKREVCEKIQFNEKLKSAQERNFFTKLTYHSVKAVLIDEILTLRRIHEESTQSKLAGNEELKEQEQLQCFYETWKEMKMLNQNSVIFLFEEAVKYTLRITPPVYIIQGLMKGFFERRKFKAGIWFWTYQMSRINFGKGNRF